MVQIGAWIHFPLTGYMYVETDWEMSHRMSYIEDNFLGQCQMFNKDKNWRCRNVAVEFVRFHNAVYFGPKAKTLDDMDRYYYSPTWEVCPAHYRNILRWFVWMASEVDNYISYQHRIWPPYPKKDRITEIP